MSRRVFEGNNNNIIIHVNCGVCEKLHVIKMPSQQYFNWNSKGESIQNACPEMSADDRELLISGTCGPCFDRICAEPEEEEEEEEFAELSDEDLNAPEEPE